jgi:hypothetical protein
MGATTIKSVLGSTLILVSAAWYFFAFQWVSPPFDARIHDAIGEVMGQEVLKLSGGKGRVVLIQRDSRTTHSPASDAQVRALARVLRAGGSQIAVTNVMKVDPLRVPSVPPGDFFQILKKAAEGDVVVSLLGPPALTDQMAGKLDASGAKVVALCAGAVPRTVNLKELFQKNLLNVAVVDRPSPPALTGDGATGRALFDRYYQVITAANAGEADPGRSAR